MKTKKSLAIAIGILLAFVIGMLLGLVLTNPGMNVIEAAGTIGKVDKYRNVNVTAEDIELRNDLITDESLKESYQNYLMVEYTSNVKMGDDIQFAVEAGRQTPGFNTLQVQTMRDLEEYVIFLDNARLQILEAIAALDDMDRKGHIAIRTVMNNAGNALAQTKYRGNILYAFLHDVEQFLHTAGKEDYPQLAKAHDLLFANLFFSGIMNGDSPGLKYLMKKERFTENENLAMDLNSLEAIYFTDVERLNAIWAYDTQRLMYNLETVLECAFWFESILQDTETPGSNYFDAEQLGVAFLAVSEQLRGMEAGDFERLNAVNSHTQLFNHAMLGREQLNALFGNQ